MDEIVSKCDKCGKEIPRGTAYVCIQQNIEQVLFSFEENNNYAEVIDSNILFAMCGRCGNQFDYESLVNLLKIIPFKNEKMNN